MKIKQNDTLPAGRQESLMSNDQFMVTKYLIKTGESRKIDELYTLDKTDQKRNYLFKVVVEEGGNLELKGKVMISKNAVRSDVYLKMQVLLLGVNARAVVIPDMEILCNEVKAGHAASIGRVDENQIFYLMSRGLTRPEAVELLVKAFLE